MITHFVERLFPYSFEAYAKEYPEEEAWQLMEYVKEDELRGDALVQSGCDPFNERSACEVEAGNSSYVMFLEHNDDLMNFYKFDFTNDPMQVTCPKCKESWDYIEAQIEEQTNDE